MAIYVLLFSTNLIIIQSRIPVCRRILSRVKHIHLVIRQLEIKHMGVILDALRRPRLGQRNKALHRQPKHSEYLGKENLHSATPTES